MITATLEKKKGQKLGLKLTSEGEKLFVTKIAEGGAMAKAKTELEVGMEVLTINGEDCEGMPSTDAAKLMMDTDGTLTIEARHPQGAYVVGTFNKENASTKVGLRLEEGEDTVMINSIREGTLAATTELGGGMAIRLINNVDCVGKDAMFVAQLLADAVGLLTVVAETPASGDLSNKDLVTATVEKKAGAKLGLTLTEVDDTLIVTKIKEGGLMAGTPLKEGMEIFSINNIIVAGKSSTDAAGILIDAKGTITILAFKNEDDEESSDGVPVAAAAAAVGTAAAAGTAAAVANAGDDDEPEIEVSNEEEPSEAPEEESTAAAVAAAEPDVEEPEEAASATDEDAEEPPVAATAAAGAAAAGVASIPRATTIKSTLPPGTLTMVVIKKEPGEKLGLRLGQKKDVVVVSGLGEGSLASKTAIQPGMILLLINGETCVGKDTADIAKMLGAAGDDIQIVAETPGPTPFSGSLVTAAVNKEEGAKVGVTLTQQGSKLLITKIKEESLLADTDLRVGMEVLSIDNTSCVGKTSAQAAEIFKGVDGTLMVIARKPALEAGILVTAALARDSPDAKLGIRLGMTGGTVVVTSFSPNSLASKTDLEPGMAIRTINNVDVAGMESTDAAGMLKDTEGIITILAETRKPGTPAGTDVSSLVVASVLNTKGANLGLTLTKDGRKFVITSIDKDGLFFGTALRVGMEVLKINNVSSTILSKEAQELLMAKEGTLTVLAKRKEIMPGSLMTAVICKEDSDMKVGLGLGVSNGLIVITKIRDGTLGAMTDLRPGMAIRTVNNITCDGMDSMGVAQILSQAEGTITIVAEAQKSKADFDVKAPRYFTATFEKEEGSKVGLALTSKKGSVFVSKIADDGLVANTGLDVGMEVVTINNIDFAGKTTAEAAEFLQAAQGQMTILAKKPPRTPGSLVTASVTKETVDSKVGLKLGLANGDIVVAGIGENSLISKTELEPGMVVKSIDNVDVTGMDVTEAANLLINAEGILTILAETPKGRAGGAGASVISSLVTATALKSEGESHGVTLERKNGKLLVSKIEDTGTLFGTGLRLGMQVVAINNIDCSMLSDSAANDLLTKDGALTILAKPVALPPGTLITAAFTKDSPASKVGLGLGKSNGVVVVTRVANGSPAATTGLEPGMVVRAINNIDCTKRSSEMAAKLLKESTGTISILAEKPTNRGVDLTLPVSCLFAVTFNKEKDGKVGLVLNNKGGKLTVGSIKEDSLVSNTRLRVGMEVMKINNVDCSGTSPSEAAALLANTEGSITLLARKAASPPGTIVTATITKTSDAKVGIGLGALGEATAITNIRDNTLAAATDLEVGMIVRTINNVDVGELEASEAAKLLAEEGKITIVAEMPSTSRLPSLDSLVTATIEKEKEEKLGLTVAQKGEKIFVSKIKPGSLVAGQGLAVGMELLSINNEACGGKPSTEVAQSLADADGTLTLLARKAALPPGSFVTAVIFKESVETKVGLRLGAAGGVIVVSGLAEDSLAAASDLSDGMIIRSINNVDCTGMEPPDVAKLLMQAEGAISILAETPQDRGVAAEAPKLASFVTVGVSSVVGEGIGVKLVREQGKLLVSEISEDSLVMGSKLRGGMEVVKINNVACGVLTAAAATELLKEEEVVTILARKPVNPPGTLITAVVRKESADSKVGMKMGMSQGKIVVSGVSDGSLASTTPLEAGMVVKSINNINVTKKDPAAAAKILSGAVGLITILAEVPSKAATASVPVPTLVTVSVDKAADTEAGVTFSKNEETLSVASVAKDGLWAKTRLRVGMEVLMINGLKYEDKTAEDVERILQDMDGKVTILAKTEKLAPGTLVTAVMAKEGPDDKVGIGIGSIRDKVVITSIKNDTLASPTDLQSGMILRLVNNINCADMDSSQVGKLLAESEGSLTIVAQVPGASSQASELPTPVAVTVVKNADDVTGMTLLDKSGTVYICKIKDDGLVAGTGLRVGMELVSINNHQCASMKATECALMMKDTIGDMTILAQSPALAPGALVTAVINKESVDTKVGLKMGDANGKVLVTGIAEGSLAEGTDLKPGMTVRMINNVDCTGLSVSDAAKLLIEAEGALTILASTPLKSAPDEVSMSSICAVSFVQSGDDDLGMTLTRVGGYPVVSTISEKGLVYGSPLRIGMEILKINNVDCSMMTADAATTLMQQEGEHTILARKKTLPAGFLVTGVIVKESPEVKVGLGMGTKNGLIYVTKIRDGAVGALTELQPGMIIRSIDNIDLAGVTLVDAANILANAEGTVTVAAEVPGAEAVASTLLTATILKSKDEKVGIALSNNGGVLFISQIRPDGLLANTDLKVGMQILAINNIQCTGLSIEDAATLLKEADGYLTVLARKPVLSPGSLVTAIITKESVDSKIGIRLSAAAGGVIVIKGISEGSLASHTELKPGMIVKSINNESTANKEATAAAKMLTGAEGTLTVVAEIPSDKPMPASALITVTLGKDKGSPTGLILGKKYGKTAVLRILEDSLLFGSPLRPGMEVLKINNVDTRVLTSESAMLLMEGEEMVTILARKTLKRAGVLVAATFNKPTADTKAGLGLGAKKGMVVITKVANGTPASTTQIQTGMVIRQINSIPCDNLGPTEVAQELASSVGLVTLLLETPGAEGSMGSASLNKSLATAAIDKDGSDIGVSFRSKNGHLFVGHVSEDGLFASSGLRPGMAMLSINNLNCAKKMPDEAIEILEKASGIVTVLTQKPFLGPGEIVTASITREDTSTPIGIGLGSSSKTGKVVITSIKPGSLAFYTDLYPGMAVQAIDNQSLKRKSPEEAASILSEATGTFSIAAESMLEFDVSKLRSKAGTIAATITATVVKAKGDKVGLLLGEKGKKLFVSKIVPGGLMSQTPLKVGMEVVSINNVDCANLPVADAASILMEADGSVTVLAKQPELAPGALITVAIEKAEDGSPLGLGLGALNGKVIISSIKFGSPSASSDLQVGMTIKAVNNIDCSTKSPEGVSKILAKAPAGNVMILGEAPYPPGRMVGGDATTPGRMVFDNEARPPPYGVPEGGVWVTRKYIGQTTTLYTVIGCAFLIVPGVYSILNPVDVRDVYIYNGNGYTADGVVVGAATKQQSE